jgi:hypothetical protein
VIARSEKLSRRCALLGASSLVALAPLSALPASGSIPALFAQWEAAWGPYIAALNEYGRVEDAFFADKTPEKEAARDRAEAAKDAIEEAVIELEYRIFEAPAVTLTDVRCKLFIRSKTIGYGNGDIEDAQGDKNPELLLRLLADVERLAGKAVAS